MIHIAIKNEAIEANKKAHGTTDLVPGESFAIKYTNARHTAAK